MSKPREHAKVRGVLFGVLLALAVLSVYLQALGGPLLWDDRLLILDAPLVEGDASLSEYFSRPFWSGAGAQPTSASYFRPLVTLSFALDQRLHASNAGGFHLTNVVLHLTNALLLFAVLGKARVRAEVAALLAGVWALQPRLAEAAAWISGRADLLATAFALSALAVWEQKLWRRGVAALFLLLGLFAKESALAVLPVLCVREWLSAQGRSPSARMLSALGRVGPLVLALSVYLGLRVSAVGLGADGERLGAFGRAGAVLQAVGTYTLMLLDAWRPRALIGRVGVASYGAMGAGALALAAAVFGAYRYRDRVGVEAKVGAALAVCAFVPVLHVVPLPLRTFAADRFLYLPSAGVVLAVAGAVERMLGGSRPRWLAALALTGSLGVASFGRVAVWCDEVEFWVRTYLETPRINNVAATNLASLYYHAGLTREALALAERAFRYDDPSRGDSAYYIGLCLNRLGRRSEALDRFGAIEGRSLAVDVGRSVAVAELQSGRFFEARRKLEELVGSGDAGSRPMLALLPEFEAAYRELERLGPSGDPARRAKLAAKLGDESRALPAWREVLLTRSASRETLVAALRYLVNTGDSAAIAAAFGDLEARFGPDPVLAGIVEVRLAELERLRSALPRLDLASGS